MSGDNSAITPRVIGAGFGRTGTASLKRALEMIGFGPCHHMEEVMKHRAEVKTWEAAARELMEAFPLAKVILTVRDPASWYASLSQTIVLAMNRFPNRIGARFLPFIGAPVRAMSGTRVHRDVIGSFEEREHVLRVFTDHIEEVQRIVPAERLLVYQVSEGWEPLCAFLGVPVPDAPFPRVNDTAEFKRAVGAMTACAGSSCSCRSPWRSLSSLG
jgi:hypothetical protein